MELIAKLKTVHDIIERKDFKSRKVWVNTDTDGKYPQTIEVEVAQDKTGIFDNIAPGSEVKLYINLRGREWTSPEGKTSVFNTLSVWKVEVLQGAVNPTAATQPASLESSYVATDEKDDLPF